MIIYECDECREVQERNKWEEEMFEEGWLFKNGRHICSVCAEKIQEEALRRTTMSYEKKFKARVVREYINHLKLAKAINKVTISEEDKKEHSSVVKKIDDSINEMDELISSIEGS